MPACSYAVAAACRVSVLTSGRTWHASCHGSLVSTDALIFTARLCCSRLRVFSLLSVTSTAAAAPSQFAEHIDLVLGYEIITSFMICSRVNRFWYAASGLSVE